MSLKAAFKQIEQQTNLFVDYSVRDVNDSRIIEELPKASNVKSVLEQLLNGTGCVVTFSNGHAIIAKEGKVAVATGKITGDVKDQKGEPVIGANVVEKGTWIAASVLLVLTLASFVLAPKTKQAPNEKTRSEKVHTGAPIAPAAAPAPAPASAPTPAPTAPAPQQ